MMLILSALTVSALMKLGCRPDLKLKKLIGIISSAGGTACPKHQAGRRISAVFRPRPLSG